MNFLGNETQTWKHFITQCWILSQEEKENKDNNNNNNRQDKVDVTKVPPDANKYTDSLTEYS